VSSTVFIKEYNICAVDIWSILNECYDDICTNFIQYNIEVKTKISSDVKNICLHYMIYNICKFTVSQKLGVKVIFYYDTTYTSSSLHSILPHGFLQKCIKKIASLLPMKLYNIDNVSYADYVKFLDNKCGNRREYILKLVEYTNKIDFSSFTFSKTISFIKRHDLYLLDKQLLTDLKAKQLLLA